MKPFQDVVKEINRTLNELILFENLVNTTLVFLVFYFLLTILDFRPMYALIPAILYMVLYTYIRTKLPKFFMVESKHAPLREKLRTAADNLHMDNPVLQELEYEVTSEMKNVGLSMFINPKTLSYKIFAVMLLSFMIIFATTMNLRLVEFAKHSVPNIFDTKNIKGISNLAAVNINTSADIFGKNNVAKLGDNELNIRIKPVDFKVNVKEEGQFKEQKFETIFPKDAVVKETTSYEENIPLEQQELVKNYFKKLAES